MRTFALTLHNAHVLLVCVQVFHQWIMHDKDLLMIAMLSMLSRELAQYAQSMQPRSIYSMLLYTLLAYIDFSSWVARQSEGAKDNFFFDLLGIAVYVFLYVVAFLRAEEENIQYS